LQKKFKFDLGDIDLMKKVYTWLSDLEYSKLLEACRKTKLSQYMILKKALLDYLTKLGV